MIRLSNLKMPLEMDAASLRERVCALLRLNPGRLRACRMVKQAVDARRKDAVHFVVAVEVEGDFDEQALIRRYPKLHLQPVAPRAHAPSRMSGGPRAVVVGSGPAGLFAALTLAQAGARPILIERGGDVDRRVAQVARLRLTSQLDPACNVQFGEGGAGTFSDGKLTTGIKDPRMGRVIEGFLQAGAPETIAYQAKPHIGTDQLRRVVRALRERILALGGQVRFDTQLTGLAVRQGRVVGARVTGPAGEEELPCQAVVLAIGHSARDTFQMLQDAGVALQAKPFAVGVRIEHLQRMIDRSQYGDFAGHPALGAADYKLSCHLPTGRSVYTFCMCPGGEVVAAASEAGGVVTNGMSDYARAGVNANSALLVGVDPADYGDHPLAGVAFQRRWEQAAFALGGGGYRAPAQLVGDFLAGRPSTGWGAVKPSYKPGVVPADLSGCLPAFVVDSLRQALPLFERRIAGFAQDEAVLTGVETRSSSPVRIPRGEDGQSNLPGLYPCGEGAGYAGGIMSAAVDGIRTAEAVLAAADPLRGEQI